MPPTGAIAIATQALHYPRRVEAQSRRTRGSTLAPPPPRTTVIAPSSSRQLCRHPPWLVRVRLHARVRPRLHARADNLVLVHAAVERISQSAVEEKALIVHFPPAICVASAAHTRRLICHVHPFECQLAHFC